MSTKFNSLEAFLSALQEQGVREVEVSARVVTTMPAGGERVVYRGRVVVKARLVGQAWEYVEIVKPLAHTSGASGPQVETGAKKLPKGTVEEHRRLAHQLRYYRESFEWRVNEAREQIINTLRAAGCSVNALAKRETVQAQAQAAPMPSRAAGLRRLGEDS